MSVFLQPINKNLRLGACFALCCVIFLVGFYPYQWVAPFEEIENGARLDRAGVAFSRPGLLKGGVPPAWLADVKKSQKFIVEILLSPAGSQLLPEATIVALAANRLDRSFAIEQDGKGLLVWLRDGESNLKGQPYFVDNVFSDAEKWYRIGIEIDAGMLLIWVDEDLLIKKVLSQDGLSFWADDHQLSVGNELTGERPWLGVIRRVHVSSANKEYDLFRSSTLNIPVPMTLLKGAYFTQLVPFSTGVNADIIKDWLVNFFGFVPVGVLLALSLERRKLLATTLCSALLSLSVEIGQQFILERTTQADDLILNTFGGMFGAILILSWCRLNSRIQNDVSKYSG